MSSDNRQDILYLNATSAFLDSIDSNGTLSSIHIENLSQWTAAFLLPDGSVSTNDQAAYYDWQNALKSVADGDDLKGNKPLYYFAVMREYIRQWFLRGKRSETYLRDILSLTEFSKNYSDPNIVNTNDPEIWTLWLKSIEKAKATIEPN